MRSVLVAVGVLAACLAVSSAQAREFHYRCEDRSELRATFTPDRVHIKRAGKDWTLARVRAAGAARYTHKRAGLELIAQRKDVVLIDQGVELRCGFTIEP